MYCTPQLIGRFQFYDTFHSIKILLLSREIHDHREQLFSYYSFWDQVWCKSVNSIVCPAKCPIEFGDLSKSCITAVFSTACQIKHIILDLLIWRRFWTSSTSSSFLFLFFFIFLFFFFLFCLFLKMTYLFVRSLVTFSHDATISLYSGKIVGESEFSNLDSFLKTNCLLRIIISYLIL